MRKSVVLLTMALLMACSSDMPDSELYGTYVASYQNGTERVTLQKDGTFVQEVRLKGSETVTVNSGTWRRVSPSNRPDIVDLENCWGVGDGFGNIRPDFAARRGGCSLPVERRFVFAGQLRLGPDESSPLWKE